MRSVGLWEPEEHQHSEDRLTEIFQFSVAVNYNKRKYGFSKLVNLSL